MDWVQPILYSVVSGCRSRAWRGYGHRRLSESQLKRSWQRRIQTTPCRISQSQINSTHMSQWLTPEWVWDVGNSSNKHHQATNTEYNHQNRIFPTFTLLDVVCMDMTMPEPLPAGHLGGGCLCLLPSSHLNNWHWWQWIC